MTADIHQWGLFPSTADPSTSHSSKSHVSSADSRWTQLNHTTHSCPSITTRWKSAVSLKYTIKSSENKNFMLVIQLVLYWRYLWNKHNSNKWINNAFRTTEASRQIHAEKTMSVLVYCDIWRTIILINVLNNNYKIYFIFVADTVCLSQWYFISVVCHFQEK